jgi:hypothetical protein
MSGPKHTPLPWRQGQVGVAIEIEGARGETVGVTLEAVDAALIVRAVNAHAGLLEALERLAKVDLLWAWDGSLTIEENCERARKQIASVANAALAKVRGA